MINTQDELCQRAAALRRAADDIHIAPQDKIITIFETGTYVLIQYTDRPPTRLHTKWAGPYKVLGHQNSEYKFLDLVTNKEKLAHSTWIKEFRFNPHVVDPLDIARRDYRRNNQSTSWKSSKSFDTPISRQVAEFYRRTQYVGAVG